MTTTHIKLDVEEVAEWTGESTRVIQRWIDAKRLPATRGRVQGLWLVCTGDLVRFLKASGKPMPSSLEEYEEEVRDEDAQALADAYHEAVQAIHDALHAEPALKPYLIDKVDEKAGRKLRFTLGFTRQ